MTVDNDRQIDAADPEEAERQDKAAPALLVKGIGASICLFILLYIGGVLPSLDVYFLSYQFNSIFLAAMFVMVFLLFPVRKGMYRQRLPWYDLLFIGGSLAVTTYTFVSAERLAYFSMLSATTLEMVLGFIAFTVLLETVRRTMGWAVVLLLVAFILYARFGYLLPGVLGISKQTWARVIANSYLGFSGMFGTITSIGSNVIFVFVAFGIFFLKVGGGDFFLNLALSLTGRVRGGPAKAAIVGSALFGMLSGSPTANVAVTGSITIPLMKRTGYSPTFSGAVEAVASTGGQIMPPIMGSIAFVMASLLGVSYRTVALAAAIPAALYFVALFTQTDLRAAKDGLRGMEKSALPSFMTALKGGWEFVIPIILLVTLLFGLRYPPSLVGVYSIGMLILISMFRKKNRISLKGIVDSLEATSRAMLMIAPILAAAGIIVALLGATGLGPRMASSLVYISGGNIAVLFILAAIASYILGMGGAMIVSYIVLAVLVAPALEMVGVPLMVSHFFVFYMGLTMFFTPPVCPTAFIAAGIAKAPAFATGFQAMRLGIVTFLVPFILIYNPALILIGEPIQIALATITAVIGVFALSVGVERYLFTKVSWLQSILAISAGITMMVPGWTSDVIGIGLLGLLLLWQWRSRKNRRATLGQNIGMDLTDGA